MDVVESSFCWL